MDEEYEYKMSFDSSEEQDEDSCDIHLDDGAPIGLLNGADGSVSGGDGGGERRVHSWADKESDPDYQQDYVASEQLFFMVPF